MGIDLGDAKSRVCTVDKLGQVVLEEWLATTPEAFFKRFSNRANLHIAMEVGTHSRWASEVLMRCGHGVPVADARQLALITNSNAKSDKRDARTLAQLVWADPRLLSPIQHRAEELQRDLTLIRQRDNLVETRTRLINSVRGVVKASGARLPDCLTGSFPQQVPRRFRSRYARRWRPRWKSSIRSTSRSTPAISRWNIGRRRGIRKAPAG